MRPRWKTRALLWAALAESVRANRQSYEALPTAWLPHGVGNTVALWLPELLAALDEACGLGPRCAWHPTVAGLYRTLREVCVDNPAWGAYVAPAVLGYVLSHPRFNIYKGELAERRFLGFGLDAIPHSVTAGALTLLVRDGCAALGHNLPPSSPLGGPARGLARHPALVSAAALALLTALWEGGEYWMQQEELRRTGGDEAAINMQWSLSDTRFDLLSNTLGWLVATAWAAHLEAGSVDPFASARPAG